MKSRLFAVMLGAAAFLGCAKPSHAWSYSNEGQWASVTYGSWTVFNDVWGNSNPSQWLDANSASNWEIVSDQTGGGVKSFGSVQATINKAISSMHSVSSSFNVSVPSSGSVYDTIYDEWTGGDADEIEIFENWTIPEGGWGTKIGSNVSIGGVTWGQIWQVNDGHNIVQFYRSSQSKANSDNTLAIMQWCKTNNRLVNTTYLSHELGFEVTSTNGWQTFEMNSFSSSWS